MALIVYDVTSAFGKCQFSALKKVQDTLFYFEMLNLEQ